MLLALCIFAGEMRLVVGESVRSARKGAWKKWKKKNVKPNARDLVARRRGVQFPSVPRRAAVSPGPAV